MNRSLSAMLLLCVMLAAGLTLGGCHTARKSQTATEYRPASGTDREWQRTEVAGEGGSAMTQLGRALAQEAYRWVGTPYRFGGHDKGGTDCSGLVMEVYGKVCHKKLPRSTTEQIAYCQPMSRRKMAAGDLVFFASGKRGGKPSHVGMYVGDGKMVHASSSRGVVVSDMEDAYWGPRYLTAARVPGVMLEATAAPKPRAVRPEASRPEASQPANTQPTETRTSTAKRNVEEQTLLDVVINQKVDSIFASQFMD